MEPRASFLSNTKGIHVGAVCAVKNLLLAMSFIDSVFYKEIGGVLGHQRVLLMQANLIDCVSHMFFKSDK